MLSRCLDIAIRIGAPDWLTAHRWGDLHLAHVIGRALTNLGHRVRVRVREDNDKVAQADVVLQLRGRGVSKLRRKQLNLLWLISHPQDVRDEELEQFDAVFVASVPYAHRLASRLRTQVVPLLQCTDPETMFADPRADCRTKLLFVGNSRMVERPILVDLLAIDPNPALTVIGANWRGLSAERFVLRQHQPYAVLRHLYSSCDVLLNDHWDDMRRHGFLSNRLFDALACGTTIVSDNADSLHDVFGDHVHTYGDREGLKKAVDRALGRQPSDVAREERRAFVLEHHSAHQRASTILSVIEERLLARGVVGGVAPIPAVCDRSSTTRVSVVYVVRDEVYAVRDLLEPGPPDDRFVNHETVIVDNASTDATAAFLGGTVFPGGVVVVRSDKRLSLADAYNLGASAAGGEYLAFPARPLRLVPERLDALLGSVDAADAEPRHDVAEGEASVAGIECGFVRRAVFDAAGGFDPAVPLAEDGRDLCARVREIGGRVHRVALACPRRAARARWPALVQRLRATLRSGRRTDPRVASADPQASRRIEEDS